MKNKNSLVKRFLSLFLISVIVLNISFKPVKLYAEPVTIAAISLKVVATILTSMGVIGYVIDKEESLPVFFDKLDNYVRSKYNVELSLAIFDILKNSLISNTKMKVSQISIYIKEFFENTYTVTVPDLPEIPDMPDYDYNPILNPIYFDTMYFHGTYEGYYDFLQTKYFKNFYLPDYTGYRYFDVELPNGFNVVVGGAELARTVEYWDMFLYKDGSPVSFVDKLKIIHPNSSNIYFGNHSDIFSVSGTFSYDRSKVNAYFTFTNGTLGRRSYIDMTGFFPLGVFEDIPPFEIPVPDVPPIVKDVPSSGLSFPLGLTDVDVNSFVGQSLDDLIAAIALDDLFGFLQGIKDIPKTNIDTLFPPVVDVGEDGLILGVDVPVVDVPVVDVPSVDVSGITGLLSNILSFLQGIFEIPKDAKINFEPLMLTSSITEKFPFSLPWDLKRVVSILVSPPKAPRWEIPILSELIVIDFVEFEHLAFISRSFLSITFIVSLIILTKRFL